MSASGGQPRAVGAVCARTHARAHMASPHLCTLAQSLESFLQTQEKLEQMQTDRTTLKGHVVKVQQENVLLRQALHKENPSK